MVKKQKVAAGMTNSVEPDQTAPKRAVRSGTALFNIQALMETNGGSMS